MAFLKGIIFDIDGTLVDSNRGHARAWHKAFSQWGISVSLESLRSLIGLHPEHLVRKFLNGTNYHYSKVFQIIETHDQIFAQEEAIHVRPLAGTQRLIAKLHKVGVPMEIASSALLSEIQAMTRLAGVMEYFSFARESPDHVISSNIEKLEIAAQRLRITPAECIFICDTPYDVEAADRLRMTCVALRSGGWDTGSLCDARAIYDDLEDLWFRFSSSCLREPYLAFKNAGREDSTSPVVRRAGQGVAQPLIKQVGISTDMSKVSFSYLSYSPS